jgi:glycosyltransferase involved in cell wall biosynthesis
MASGTPVVASPNDGAVEVTANGRFGIVAPDYQLANALIKVLVDPALRMKLREAGLARSRDFSWSRVCEMYESLFVVPSAAAHPAGWGS